MVEAVRKVWPRREIRVEEALAVVEAKLSTPIVEMSEKRAVDDAWRPPWNQIGVEVELTLRPKFVFAVNGKEPPVPVESVPQ